MKISCKYRSLNLLRALFLVAVGSIPLFFIAACHQKTEVAADQPVAVRLRTPNRVHEPVSVSASGAEKKRCRLAAGACSFIWSIPVAAGVGAGRLYHAVGAA